MPQIDNDIKLDFKDVLIRPKRSTLASRSEVSLSRTFVMPATKQKWTGVPIIAANMDSTGTFAVAEVLARRNMITAIHKHYTIAQWKDWLETAGKDVKGHVMISTGITQDDLAKLDELMTITGVKMICVDVANGYSENFARTVKDLRGKYQDCFLVAGNVCTGEMTEELILSGADMVKVGIGPGSVCITRKQTGVGYPQLSSILECADAAHGLGGLIIADGGCSCPGDVAKAFGAGADFVMCGGMFAGHDECGGELYRNGSDGKIWQVFYGMSSATAMNKYAGGVAEYRSSEGRTTVVPYKGPIDHTILDLLGGLRSACTYVGAAHLKELSRRTTFMRVTQQQHQAFSDSPQLKQLEPVVKTVDGKTGEVTFTKLER